jgi:hypothetical protein
VGALATASARRLPTALDVTSAASIAAAAEAAERHLEVAVSRAVKILVEPSVSAPTGTARPPATSPR